MVAKYGDIRAQLAQIIADNLEGEETLEQLKENDDLTQLEINSILFIKIIVSIENQFNIENLMMRRWTIPNLFQWRT